MCFFFFLQVNFVGIIAKSFSGVSFFEISSLDKSSADEAKPCSAFELSKHIFATLER